MHLMWNGITGDASNVMFSCKNSKMERKSVSCSENVCILIYANRDTVLKCSVVIAIAIVIDSYAHHCVTYRVVSSLFSVSRMYIPSTYKGLLPVTGPSRTTCGKKGWHQTEGGYQQKKGWRGSCISVVRPTVTDILPLIPEGVAILPLLISLLRCLNI